MKSYERLWNTINSGYSEELPLFPIIGFHSAYVYGVSYKEVLTNPDLMADLQHKTYGIYDSDFITPVMDLTAEAEALGVEVFWKDRDGRVVPAVKGYLPLTSIDSLKDRESDFINLARLPVFIKATRRLSEIKGQRVLCSYVIGPTSLMGNLFGIEKVVKYLMRYPDVFGRGLDYVTLLLIQYSKALIEAGAECIAILDPLSAILSPKVYERYIFPKITSIINEVKKNNAISILHVCGDANHILKYMCLSGAHILSIDKYVDIEHALRICDKVIMGNIPTQVFLISSPSEIERMTIEAIRKSKGERHIIASGCEIPPESPCENILAMVKTTRKFRRC